MTSRGGVRVPGERFEVAEILNQAVQAPHVFVAEDGNYQTNHAHQHDDALNQIGVGGCDIASGYQIDGGEGCHDQHPDPGFNAGKDRAEQGPESFVYGGGVGDEKNENDNCRKDLHALGIVALFKIVGHGSGVQFFGHLSGFVRKQEPGKQTAEDGVSDADPDGADADIPAVLSRVTDENHGGEIGRSVSERRCPGTDVSASDQKMVQRFGLACGKHPDQRHENGVHRKGHNGIKLWLRHFKLPPKCRGEKRGFSFPSEESKNSKKVPSTPLAILSSLLYNKKQD